MGCYSTMDITKVDALKEIFSEIFKASDSQLEDILFTLIGQRSLNNFKIVEDYSSDWHIKYRKEESE